MALAGTSVATNSIGAALGAAGLAGLAPALGGLGLVVTAAGIMAMNACTAPLCIAVSGQCCFLAPTSRGIVCPDSC